MTDALLSYKDKELRVLLSHMEEALRLLGLPAKIQFPEGDGFTVAKDTRILLDEEPKPDTLKRLGWYVSRDDMPILAYVSSKQPVVFGTLLTLPGAFEEAEPRKFTVTRIQSWLYTPVIFICQLAPAYDSEKTPETTGNFSVLNVGEGV